jgi:CDP-paratose 2-epimerase
MDGAARDGLGPALVTGGAGFIGCNLADRLLASGRRVTVLDDFSRDGVSANARWLEARHGAGVRIVRGDVRDPDAVRAAMRGATAVFHFAAQVAVTTSLADPRHDFEVNARGTLNVLEEARALDPPPALVYTSTNKVYGALADVPLEVRSRRHEPAVATLRDHGVDESRPLDFHSPYGCSKGSADQYVRDYARSFGIPAVVFRMSCIYGEHQFGTEDQGWVAHLLIRALDDRPLTIYGDGMQVRDVLDVEDLVNALTLAGERAAELAGRAFNIGGGPARTLSLLELVEMIAERRGRRPEVRFAPWRAGDQRWYVSNTTAFERATGWQPRIGVREGVARLERWLSQVDRGDAAAFGERVASGRAGGSW